MYTEKIRNIVEWIPNNRKCNSYKKVNEGIKMKEGNDIQELREVFEKYALKYNMEEEAVIEDQNQIDRQWYIYKRIKEKQLKNTNVEKLIDLITDDIRHQYEIKSDIENKIAFLFAFCGVMLALVLEQGVLTNLLDIIVENKYNLISKIFGIACLVLFGGSAIVAFVFMSKCLLRKLNKPLYDDKDNYFRCAVDDKDMSFVYILDVNTNVWINNEKDNKKRFRWFEISLKSILCLIISIFIISFFCYILKI